MHDDGDKGYGGNEERYNDNAVFRFLDKILCTQRQSLQLQVSPIAVYEKCFEYGMRRGGAANYAGYKK